MSLFQPSVIKKYLILQDSTTIHKAYKKYIKYFHNGTIQKNTEKTIDMMVYELYGLSNEEISIVEGS